MAEGELWGEMLNMLKDIAEYLKKQDAIQERAKIDKPPKIQETQKPIKGAEAPAGMGPAKGIAKEFVPVPSEGTSVGESTESSLSGETESTMLKQKTEEEIEELEELPEEETEETTPTKEEEKTVSELKSLLKDIRATLVKKSVSREIIDGVKKELPSLIHNETERMLRKMGFTPSRPDILKLGTGEPIDIKKSEDEVDKKREEVAEFVDKQSRKTWQELAQERDKLGLFSPFPK